MCITQGRLRVAIEIKDNACIHVLQLSHWGYQRKRILVESQCPIFIKVVFECVWELWGWGGGSCVEFIQHVSR